ncbi:MAG: AMP-binding protein [Nocardioidaceae bacterium]
MTLRPMVAVWAEMAQTRPEQPAVTVGRRPSISWAELHRRSNRLARLLGEEGVAQGDFVTLMLPMSEFAIVGIIATLKLGAIPNPISAKLPGRERDELLALVDPKVLISESEVVGRLCVTGEPGADYDDTDLPEVIAPSYKAPTSGGSTGRPKLILSGQPALIDDGDETMLRRLGFPVDSCTLFPGPLYHNTALLGSIVSLSLRNHLVVEEKFDPELTLGLIDRHRVEYTIVVPTMMNRMLALPEEVRRSYDLSSLNAFVHNAAPCPPHIKRAWMDWIGPEKVFENYTATEHTAQTYCSGIEWLEHPGTVGRVVWGEMQIRDAEGTPLPAGEVGAIWWRRDEDTPRTFTYIGAENPDDPERWETVGDLGYFDEDGYLYLADRRTDMIISGGANIYPAEVEGALTAHRLVVDSVVVGLPDEDMGQLTHAIVQIDPAGETPTSEELDAYMQTMLARYKCPRTYEFTTDQLRNDAGKVRRTMLAAERAGGVR